MPLQPHEALERYDVDRVKTTDKLDLKHLDLLVIKDRVDLERLSSSTLDFDWTRKAIETCRVVKDDHEIAMIRHANIVSSYAHRQALAAVKKCSNERELNAVFVMHCHANGCKEQSYDCICAAGTNASTLHYVHNDLPLQGKLNLLMDAGAEYECYCADITRTFPLNGKFTKESRQIYELVLKMQTECMGMIREGALWDDIHLHAHSVAAAGLKELGILKGDTKHILESKVTSRFFPHGLGHYLGMDTHDTGGNANYEDPDPLLTYLRVRGHLPAGAVITNEPGIYFREFPLRQELKDGKWKDYIDEQVLEKYWTVGGVRIEDDILVTKEGCLNLTTITSKIEEIEALVNGEVTP